MTFFSKNKNIILILAISVFISCIVLVFNKTDISPEVFLSFEMLPVVFFTLVAIIINCHINLEIFRTSGALVSFRHAARVTVISSASSLIPLAGPTLAKFAYLKKLKVGNREGGRLLIIAVGVNVITTLAIGALGFFSVYQIFRFQSLAVLVLLVLLLLLVIGYFTSYKHVYLIRLGLGNLLMVIVEVIRLFLIFKAINFSIEIDKIVGLQVSNLATLGASVVPGGLGLKEGAASILGVLMSTDPKMVFLAYAVNRIVGFCVVLLLALMLLKYER